MIKITDTEVYGWKAAIRGMRNPMNSWDKSDSEWDGYGKCDGYSVGTNDLSLMKKLVASGTDHRKFMRMLTVYTDITAPLYWWKEFDTYKVGTVANSCSTMHKIHAKEFTLDDFSHEHLTDHVEDGELCRDWLDVLEYIVEELNMARQIFHETKDKKYWWQMIQLLPQSYNQKRTVLLNYEVLTNMYHSRKAHKLDEWRSFCKWIESLPESELIVGGINE